jgi:hypothetical protein
MNQQLFTLSALLLAPPAPMHAADPATANKPNVLVIVADEVGTQAVQNLAVGLGAW